MEHERKPIGLALVSEFKRASDFVKEFRKIQKIYPPSGFLSQFTPFTSGGHSHVYPPFMSSVQAPLFWHGFSRVHGNAFVNLKDK